MGRNHDPVTLHKYLYANADPVNGIDPSGYYTMTQMSATTNIIGIQSVGTVGRVGFVSFAANDAVIVSASQAGFATLRAMGASALTALLVNKDSVEEEDRERKVDLSRAVGDTELASMYTCFCFSLGRNGFPKQFFHTDAEAITFGRKFNLGQYNSPRFHLVQASISFWLYEILDHEANEPGIGPIVTVQHELLPAFNLDMNKHGGFRYKSTFENNLP